MTFLVTIHAIDYALIAADKMEVAQVGADIIPVRMDVDKIIDTGIGLMTGSGYVTLLDAVKKAVSNAEITHTDQILRIILHERSAIENSSCISEQQKSEFVKNTGWLFTYLTQIDRNPRIRVAFYSPHISEKYLSLVEENRCNAFFPSDATKDIRDSFIDILKNNMASSKCSSTIEATLTHNTSLVLRLMSDMSKISSFVSEVCDIGIVLLGGKTLMAKIISIHTPNISFKDINS